jgi:signal peptidase I
LAHEDSWLSFLVDAILVILIGKFLILPGLGLALGTDYPLVAVVSSSMDHHGQSFDAWWSENGAWYESHNITKEKFEIFYKYNGFKKGDAFVVKGVAADKLKVGDIIVYSVEERVDPIIHRIVSINKDNTFVTKGDANSAQFPFELSVETSQIQGKTVQWIPYFGWLKAGMTDIINKFK